jgi:hypothetical protein
MRKRYRAPGRGTCPLCKPEKMGWEHRWKAKEEAGLRAFEEVRARTRWQNWREEFGEDAH